jgi:hypothetical protein
MNKYEYSIFIVQIVVKTASSPMGFKDTHTLILIEKLNRQGDHLIHYNYTRIECFDY